MRGWLFVKSQPCVIFLIAYKHTKCSQDDSNGTNEPGRIKRWRICIHVESIHRFEMWQLKCCSLINSDCSDPRLGLPDREQWDSLQQSCVHCYGTQRSDSWGERTEKGGKEGLENDHTSNPCQFFVRCSEICSFGISGICIFWFICKQIIFLCRCVSNHDCSFFFAVFYSCWEHQRTLLCWSWKDHRTCPKIRDGFEKMRWHSSWLGLGLFTRTFSILLEWLKPTILGSSSSGNLRGS